MSEDKKPFEDPPPVAGIAGRRPKLSDPALGQGPHDAVESEDAGVAPGRDLDSAAHDQWLLDEALAETFPASDPISPSGSSRGSG